jgi:hypothetical protein
MRRDIFQGKNCIIFYLLVFTIVRIHLAHSTLRTLRPSSYTVTFWRLGRKVRGVDFFDHGRFRPNAVFLSQCAHFAILKSFLTRYMKHSFTKKWLCNRNNVIKIYRRSRRNNCVLPEAAQSYHKPDRLSSLDTNQSDN